MNECVYDTCIVKYSMTLEIKYVFCDASSIINLVRVLHIQIWLTGILAGKRVIGQDPHIKASSLNSLNGNNGHGNWLMRRH